MREVHIADLRAQLGCFLEITIDVARRVDHQRLAPAGDHVGVVREHTQVVLPKREIRGALGCLGDQLHARSLAPMTGRVGVGSQRRRACARHRRARPQKSESEQESKATFREHVILQGATLPGPHPRRHGALRDRRRTRSAHRLNFYYKPDGAPGQTWTRPLRRARRSRRTLARGTRDRPALRSRAGGWANQKLDSPTASREMAIELCK